MKFYLQYFILSVSVVTAATSKTTVINRGNGAEPDSLNIHLAQGLNSQNILMDMYEGLMTFSASGQPQYGVALSHEVNNDATLWQFYLNPAAKWSDGSTVTAADFMAAWQLAALPGTAAPYRHLFENLTVDGELQISSLHPHHLQVKLNTPDAGLLNKLVLPLFYPLPATKITSAKPAKISNGAYYLDRWDIQERIVLQRNIHFHAASEVLTEQINYWVTENQNSELLRFRAEELDITETIPDSKIDWLKQNLPNELRISPYYGTFFLGLNLNHKLLADDSLRQALSLAIDRNILVEKVLKSGQLPATQIIPPDQSAHNLTKDRSGFNLKQAKIHLASSSFKPNTDRLEILYNNSDNQKKVALAVAAMWRQNLGIKTQLKNQEWKVFVNSRRSNQKQVFRSGWIADFHDPLNFLALFQSQSHFNFYHYNSIQYDAIIQQLQSSSNTHKTNQLVAQAEALISKDIPVIPLYHYVSRHLVSQRITGFIDNEMDRHLSRYLNKSN